MRMDYIAPQSKILAVESRGVIAESYIEREGTWLSSPEDIDFLEEDLL